LIRALNLAIWLAVKPSSDFTRRVRRRNGLQAPRHGSDRRRIAHPLHGMRHEPRQRSSPTAVIALANWVEAATNCGPIVAPIVSDTADRKDPTTGASARQLPTLATLSVPRSPLIS
jgi:hypothetical protein